MRVYNVSEGRESSSESDLPTHAIAVKNQDSVHAVSNASRDRLERRGTHRPTHLYLLSSASEAGMESLRTLDMEGSWLGCCGRMCLCVRWREWRVVGERRVSQSL